MAFKHYTSCFLYPSGGKPYNEGDRAAFVITQLLVAIAIGGGAALIGLLAGPIGAIIGGVFGLIIGFTNMIDNAADQWLNHRLICLDKDNPICAVGIVSYNPTRSDLGAFDNDQFFDIVLMPHPTVSVPADFDEAIEKSSGTALVPANRYEADGTVVAAFKGHVTNHPANDIFTDKFQGQELLSTRADILADLGYTPPNSHERTALHCEAEGDFWTRIRRLAPAIAALLFAALVVTTVGAVAGGMAGAAAGCAIGGIFGPIGCIIGAIIGAIAGALAGGAAAGAASYFGAIEPVLQAIFDADPGDVEDANVGDSALGPIRMGDTVAVLGEHVYDGYHDGWNEFHPLMAVVKFNQERDKLPEHYLQWQPDFAGTPPPPPPGETIALTVDDMRKGLASDNFRKRCENLRRIWCTMLQDAFDPGTRTTQQGLEHRWTVHPAVDGCRNPDPPPNGPH